MLFPDWSAGGATAFFWPFALMSPFITEFLSRSYPKYVFIFKRNHKNSEEWILGSSWLSVCQSTWNNSASTSIYIKFYTWVFFKLHSYQTRIMGTLHEVQYTFFRSHLTQFFLECERLQTVVVENIKTNIFCSITFLKIHAVYEIMWKNIVKLGRPNMTKWWTQITCWISKA
jgi:hypothetical protein